jgi:hypothetical protein
MGTPDAENGIDDGSWQNRKFNAGLIFQDTANFDIISKFIILLHTSGLYTCPCLILSFFTTLWHAFCLNSLRSGLQLIN